MAKLGQAQEPSMEEILASIRRIISDDEQKAAAPPAAMPPKLAVVEGARAGLLRPAPAPEPERTPDAPAARIGSPAADAPEATGPSFAEAREHEILELSEADAAVPDDDSEAPDVAFADPAEAAPPEPLRPHPVAAQAPHPPGIDAVREDRPLLSQRTDEAVNTAFNQLAATFLTNQARTLEDIVKEMMRPMLKSWLDDNLPPLVERLVREEIERVSRGRR